MIKKEITAGKLVIKEVKTLTPKWGKKDFCAYDNGYVAARSKMRDKMDKCFCCGGKFLVNKDIVSLVCFDCGVGNKVLCDKCYAELGIDE